MKFWFLAPHGAQGANKCSRGYRPMGSSGRAVERWRPARHGAGAGMGTAHPHPARTEARTSGEVRDKPATARSWLCGTTKQVALYHSSHARHLHLTHQLATHPQTNAPRPPPSDTHSRNTRSHDEGAHASSGSGSGSGGGSQWRCHITHAHDARS